MQAYLVPCVEGWMSYDEYQEHRKTCKRCEAFWKPAEQDFSRRLIAELEKGPSIYSFMKQFAQVPSDDAKTR